MKFFEKLKFVFTLHFKHGEKIDINYPDCWEKMSMEQFRNVCCILDKPHGRKETLFLCLCALANIRPDNPIKYNPKILKDNVAFIIGNQSYIISPKVIQTACSELEYILDDIGLAPSPLPKVDRKLYGVSFENFFIVDSLMARYQENHNGALLKEVCKKLTGGYIRKPLPWQAKGLVIWWAGVKKYLKEKYPYVFQEGDGSISDRTQEEILQDLLSCMNNHQPQQNELILKSEAHAVLFTLNKIYEENAHK